MHLQYNGKGGRKPFLCLHSTRLKLRNASEEGYATCTTINVCLPVILGSVIAAAKNPTLRLSESLWRSVTVVTATKRATTYVAAPCVK